MKEQKKAKLFSLKYWFVDFVRVTGAIPTYLWYRPKIVYESKSAKKKIRGGALLMCNHNCFYDPIYLMIAVWYRRHHFIINKQFLETKARWFLEHVLCIPIDIENTGFQTMKTINDHLTSGEIVSIFPEGHINDGSGEMRQFKSGMVLMAMRAKVPIVPVYIRAHEPRFSRLKIVIGEAVDINKQFDSRPSMSDIEKVTQQLFEKESQLKEIAFHTNP
ncbi:MAG: 1-acyl-sn-glycerol-3-phosphate acyltransferase [Ruminococcus sp.]|nr:1-acyl-sn-glycerol-3-phosphate acyltransferase [Ruminococcus sp.]MBQ1898653.1 1-acyl-sn-glycerol-3-phosphate acyltransferase [Ruminococcus sp.]MBQ4238886.1 1-acyl-sn-glycerol-3-phosphate acyltransferase [Ruminococcus sp.]